MPTASEPLPLPDVLRPHCFAHEQAVAAGKRSGEVRRERARLRELERDPKDKPPPPNAIQQAINAQLELVAEQIAHTRRVLNDKQYGYCEHCERAGIEPHHRAQLLKALDTLLDRQRKLLGIADPGVLKPQASPKAGSRLGGLMVGLHQVDPAPEPPAQAANNTHSPE